MTHLKPIKSSTPKSLSPMKHVKFFALSLSIASTIAVSTGFAQTATTDPVGFITMGISGGTLASPKLTLLSPTLTRPVVWQGTILTISPTAITVSGTPWSTGQFNGANGEYYVEVFSTTNPGALSDISNTTSNSITIEDNLTSFGAVGDSIRIRKHVTIADLFGATNSAGLFASDEPATADEVLIYDGAQSVSYFYYTGDPGQPAGWYNSGTNEAAANQAIKPHQGVVVKRKAAGVINVVSVGSVKTGNTLFPVVSGLNVLGTVSAKGLTLDNSGLANTPFAASDEPATGDEVTIYTPTTQTSYFYYTGDISQPAGWYDSGTNVAAGAIPIAPGSAFVLSRKQGRPAFNWPLPAPASF